ncbi:1,4-alpha-glucan branching protein GlgB [Paenibacillus chartarius]|uniref:1,4-alpha-glucan branching enzyme GlgB n=1 Tax=Paenibacillus chartarius TaxID=747481 RepID=A0ABV6DQ45_9BACL
MVNDAIPQAEQLYLFSQGALYHSYRMLGAHFVQEGGKTCVRFAVWAPHAAMVRVPGDFNGWDGSRHPLERLGDSGIWCGFVSEAREGDFYKYEIFTRDGRHMMKADPYAFLAELKPGTASRIYRLDGYMWGDAEWQRRKQEQPPYYKPLSIYEVHLGTWKKKNGGEWYSYREMAHELVDYAVERGYTHIELLPLTEHPYDRSWGYQSTGYFAPTSRFGYPNDLKYFVDRAHQRGLGVIMDWVPGHFCKDDHGLRQFDGQPLYEYEDHRRAEKPEWGTLSFDFGRGEVISFLISNAIYWLEEFHLDGLRVDAVASMLHWNFGKPESMWTLNQYGGDANLEAVEFLRNLNKAVFQYFPHALMMAEDSSDWPGVTKPAHEGGLGFNYKWNMGWMNDTLRYFQLDPIQRKWHHNLLTFAMMYAYSENYLLPLSHDEVVHGKRSLLNKMPGDYWQKFAQLRLLYGYMATQPGKKLLFMGGEFGQYDEWKDLEQTDWFLLEYPLHSAMSAYTLELNRLYLREPALWELDHRPDGFEWIDVNNNEQSILIYTRRGAAPGEELIVVCNFTPIVYHDYRIGVPQAGEYIEIFNSDKPEFGGSGIWNGAPLKTEAPGWHGRPHLVRIDVPPLGVVVLKRAAAEEPPHIPQLAPADTAQPAPRKRGRPRKQPPEAAEA